jgi:hypothetical protein
MRRRSTSSMDALHPVMFFTLVYGISLFLAIFVCRTVYYSINHDVASQSSPAPKSDLSYTGAAASITALK